MSFELIHKPTFSNQLLALPKDRVLQVLEKIEILREDPAPREPVKKKLHNSKEPLYRLRSGDFRIFYTYGNQWVTLLTVEDRKDAYKGRLPTPEGPGFDPEELPVDQVRADLAPDARWRDGGASPPVVPTNEDFQRPVDDELLERLRVPTEYRASLRGCRTLDELIATPVSEAVKDLVLDAVTSANIGRVLQQPDYLTGDPSDLLRFAEGELLGFLLRLDPDQEKFVDWAISGAGPTLVKGGPGTGKSTIALYRTRSLLRALRAMGNEHPRVLFTTYTSALTAFSEQLLKRLLGIDAERVEVRTADSLAWRIVESREGRPAIAEQATLRKVLKDAIAGAVFEGNALQRKAQASTIQHLTHEYLLEEINAVIEARELGGIDAYLAVPRSGRRVPLNATQRTAVWRIYESFSRLLKRRGLRSWEQLRRQALELVRSGQSSDRYDAVVVDEAQDLDPAVLRLLVSLCSQADRIFVTADANQSIYGSSFKWTDVHGDLRFQGRTGILRKNYRSTKEIGEAAYGYLRGGALDEEPLERAYTSSGGPLPVVRRVGSAYAETQLLVNFFRLAAREARLGLGSCAVLVPTEAVGRSIAARLTDTGVEAMFMPGRELDLERPVVKVITLRSAKGLEFPVVALAGFVDGMVPGPAKGAQDEEAEEALMRERRSMFVAMTRAMRGLLVVTPSDRTSPLFDGFDSETWNLGAAAA